MFLPTLSCVGILTLVLAFYFLVVPSVLRAVVQTAGVAKRLVRARLGMLGAAEHSEACMQTSPRQLELEWISGLSRK